MVSICNRNAPKKASSMLKHGREKYGGDVMLLKNFSGKPLG
jgi:hypothetical protein